MKFIFPQNYSFSTKLFGLIDYQTAIFNFVCWVVLFFVTSLLKLSLFTKIIVFIIICFPILLISIFGFHQENLIYVFKYLFTFLKKPKIYLYEKL